LLAAAASLPSRPVAGGDDWAAILGGLLAGDRVAFLRVNRLVTHCLQRLRAYDFRDEWDDLRQEVVLAVIANARAGRLRDPAAFVGYVRIITRNKFIDRLKGHLQMGADDPLPWDDETARAAVADPPAHVRADLRRALAELSDEEQRVLDGVYVRGRTYQEVSDDVGLPLGTMKRRLRDALATLRRRLAGESG
jgi:RNA polymerase sigma-70 factor (ECF subfamily)